MRLNILSFFALFACSACTVVKVEGGDVRRYGNLLKVEASKNASIVSVTTRNYGMAVDGHSLLVGYGRSRTVIVPDGSRCSAVIVVEKGEGDEQLSRWRKFFSDYPNVCIEGGGK